MTTSEIMAAPEHFHVKHFDVSQLHVTYGEVREIFESPLERRAINYPVGIADVTDDEWKKYKDEILVLNRGILESCRDRAGVYGLYTTLPNSEPQLQYVGQTIDKTSLMRMINHLVQKHQNTGAKLAAVRKAVLNKEKIELVFVEITPKELREYIEHRLIKDLEPKWNRKGK